MDVAILISIYSYDKVIYIALHLQLWQGSL